jgi:hypothetical protein
MAHVSDQRSGGVPAIGDVCDGGGPGENFRKIEACAKERDFQRRALVSIMRERVVGRYNLHLGLLAGFNSPSRIGLLVDGDFGRFRDALEAMAQRKMKP